MGLGGWRRTSRRLAGRPALGRVFDEIVPRLVALRPLAVVVFGSAQDERRRVDRWTDLDLALVVADAAEVSRVRRRLRAAVAAIGDVVLWAWQGHQALGVVERDGDEVGVDIHVITRARLPDVGRTRVRVLFDPEGMLAGWRGRRARRGRRETDESIELAKALAWRARVRVARGDRAEAEELLSAARTALLPALRGASGSERRAGWRGVEREVTARWRRALAACRPRDLTAGVLLCAVRSTRALAERVGGG